MLSEVLKTQPGQSQTSLFNLLPFISKAIKTVDIKDFVVASYMAIAQIVCRKSLSAEYAQAFFKQILISVRDQSVLMGYDENIERGLLILGLIA